MKTKQISRIEKLISMQQSLAKTSNAINKKQIAVQQEINTLLLEQITIKAEKAIVENDIMTGDEVCQMIGKSKSSLYRLRTYHNFPYTVIDGQKSIIYSRKSIEAYFKEKERVGFRR